MSRPHRTPPISPHLQIYKPQLTSVLSILHRISGFVLVLGLLGIAVWLVCLAHGAETYGMYRHYTQTWPAKFLLVGFASAFYYHLMNGIRHLVWDAGRGLTLGAVYASGWLVVFGTAILTAHAAYVVWT